MMRGLFITGTGTNIGKTVVSASLFHRYRLLTELRYWKPVQTGFPEDDDTATVGRLARCHQREICDDGVRLKQPLSPHLAAAYGGVTLNLEALIEPSRSWPATCRALVEGAGGVLVPLSSTHLMSDLISALAIPSLIVATSCLGTINHTLLTLEALRTRAIGVAGVVLVGEPNADNRRSIETYGNVAVIGEMPRFPTVNCTILKRWAETELDRANILESYLCR
jgi:dethiobiotin synthetase